MSAFAKHLYLACAFAVGLVLVVLTLLTPPTSATAGNRFVTAGGSGSACTQAAPCALQTALAQANNGDGIFVSAGTYTGTGSAVVTLTKSIALYGGWDGMTTFPPVRDPNVHRTSLDGEGQRRVVFIDENIRPTVDGFVIANGNATALTAQCYGQGQADGCGGGVFAYNTHPIISNNVITNNVAAITSFGYPTGTIGYGGGLFLEATTNAVITANLIISNAGSVAYCGMGGGLALVNSYGALVQSNQVISNHASLTDTACAWGGGIALFSNYASTIKGNWIQGNRVSAFSRGQGSGLFQWYGSDFIVGNHVVRNYATEAVFMGYSASRVEGNWVMDNSTSVGIEVWSGSGGIAPTLVNNIIARSGYQGVEILGFPGLPATPALLHNTLVGSGTGSGIYIPPTSPYVTVTMTNNIITNYALGIDNSTPAAATVTANFTLFYGNNVDFSPGVTSTNAVSGNPAFVNSAAGDFHLNTNSAAIDRGIVTGVLTDIDGQLRDAAPDIGAYEYTAPLDGVTLSGPTNGIVNASYAFTATIHPVTATQPVTYVWQATGQVPVTHTVAGVADTANFSWSAAGTQILTVTATNAGGAASTSYTLTINVPPGNVAITGPDNGAINTAYLYTATVLPPTATQPITYVWQTIGQLPVTHTIAGVSDTATFAWSIGGTQLITVTATNIGGSASKVYIATINNPAPSLTSLSPISATAGGPTFTLTVTGTNFVSTSVVRWNGLDRATTFVNSTQLQVTITAADIATAATASITVFNPTPGGGESNPATFTISSTRTFVYLPLIVR